MLIRPVDYWTIAHGMVGLGLGLARISRWFFYIIPTGWEVAELYFHYKPQGMGLRETWMNSAVDILACAVCYEIGVRYPARYDFRIWLKPLPRRRRLKYQ